MRITHTLASLRPELGGPSFSAPALCAALAARGEEVDVAVWEDRGPARPLDEENSVVVPEDGPQVMVHGGMRQAALAAHVVAEGSVLIHDHCLWRRSHVDVARAAAETGRPLVLSPRGMLLPWGLQHKWLKKKVGMALYQRRVLRQVALFHVTSEEEAQSVRDAGFRQPIALIPNGTPLPDLGALRAQAPPADGRPRTALFLSRVHPKKGIPMLLEAWARLRPEGWRLLIVGPDEGGHRADMEAEAQRLGLADVVTLREGADDDEKWALYSQAELFVLPTHAENFGLVVAEALAAGTPALTTHGAPWQELEARDCGWWVPIGTDPLFHALREATALPPEALLERGDRGRRLVEERYGWPAIARDMAASYAWLLGQGDRPDPIITD